MSLLARVTQSQQSQPPLFTHGVPWGRMQPLPVPLTHLWELGCWKATQMGAMSELTFPRLPGRDWQCLGQGWKLELAGLPAPTAIDCKTPPSRPVVPQRWWVAPCSLPETSPGPECSSLEEARGDKCSKGLQPAEITRAVPPYRVWQGKRSRRPRPCSRVGVHSAAGVTRPHLGGRLCCGGMGTVGE